MNKNTHKSPNNTVKTTYHLNGTVESKIPYVIAKKHGLATWWWDDGTKRYEVMCVDDKHHGVETGWYEDGKKKNETMWVNGESHGVTTEWREDGIKTETHVIRGKISSIVCFSPSGYTFAADFSPHPSLIPSLDNDTNNNNNNNNNNKQINKIK